MANAVALSAPAPEYPEPLGASEFDQLMDANRVPAGVAIAAAVSGGGDSMALALLADDWCRRHGGTLTALTVDHGLRAGSDAEASKVGGWLAAAGIGHRILVWDGDKPATGIQAAARAARYGLLTDWARRNRTCHILVAHNLEDQAETFLMRAAQGAGMYGLAGMAPVSRRRGVGIHRPLLEISGARLRQTLTAKCQQWIEDPSNVDPAFQRTHMRRLVTALGQVGAPATRLALLAGHFRSARTRLDGLAGALIGGAVVRHTTGYCQLQTQIFRCAPLMVALHALRKILGEIGGRDYPASGDKLERGLGRLLDSGDDRAFTLAGCRIIKAGGGPGTVLICREERNAGERLTVTAGGRLFWRGVFEIALEGRDGGSDGPVYLGPLGQVGWSEIASKIEGGDALLPPFPVRTALPALFDRTGVAEVPHLGYVRVAGRLPVIGIDWVRPAL
ncbi:MAG: tRNA lysidine(34) synthetase TilS [Rhodospirillaceae bacterium]|nr:tRNA lysidine(34) synthetase TilS [Rhodospirillaceae bacterium]MBT6861172.1 tRNA lysidine(34) synthetase TilS [Rhodospirillaceae bacterium]